MKRALGQFWAGLSLGVRSLLSKEFRSISRGARPVWLLTGYLVALTLAVVGYLRLFERTGTSIPPNLGIQVFSMLAMGAVLLLAFLTPALTSGAISGERERKTLDLLLVTRATALGLVSGKLLASLFYILFLLLATLPAFALVYLYGGVKPIYLLMVLAVGAVTAISHAAIGLLLSAALKRTAVASVIAYVTVLIMVLGLPFVASVSRAAERQGGMYSEFDTRPKGYLYASPMVALSSVLPVQAPGQQLPVIGQYIQLLMGHSEVYAKFGGAGTNTGGIMKVRYVVARDPNTGELQFEEDWSPWVYHLGISGVVTAVSLGGAAFFTMPVKPWQAWRARRRAGARRRQVGSEVQA